MKLSDAMKFRSRIEVAGKEMTDTEAIDAPLFFPTWQTDKAYATGDRFRYGGVLYKVLQDHTSQSDWIPTTAVSLYTKVLGNTIEEWEQPDSTNGYSIGDKVLYNGVVYESLIDNNVWSPETYPDGWAEVA